MHFGERASLPKFNTGYVHAPASPPSHQRCRTDSQPGVGSGVRHSGRPEVARCRGKVSGRHISLLLSEPPSIHRYVTVAARHYAVVAPLSDLRRPRLFSSGALMHRPFASLFIPPSFVRSFVRFRYVQNFRQ